MGVFYTKEQRERSKVAAKKLQRRLQKQGWKAILVEARSGIFEVTASINEAPAAESWKETGL